MRKARSFGTWDHIACHLNQKHPSSNPACSNNYDCHSTDRPWSADLRARSSISPGQLGTCYGTRPTPKSKQNAPRPPPLATKAHTHTDTQTNKNVSSSLPSLSDKLGLVCWAHCCKAFETCDACCKSHYTCPSLRAPIEPHHKLSQSYFPP